MPSAIQRFFLAIVPDWMGKAMEKDSRLWMMRCAKCRHEVSIWDIGGIRYMAYSNPRRWWRCSQCLQGSWHEVYKKG